MGRVRELLRQARLRSSQSSKPSHAAYPSLFQVESRGGMRLVESVLLLLRVIVSLPALALPVHGLLAVLASAALYLLLTPHTVCRLVLVPLGLARAAYLWSGLSNVAWSGDPRGGRLILGALAARRRPHPQSTDWLDRRIPYHQFRGASVVAMALLDEARGNRESARALMRSVEGLTEPLCPRRASALAERWLADDALGRRAWHELARGPDEPVLRRTRFLRTAARRIEGADGAVPSRLELVLRWLLSGSWVSTWQMLQEAWNPPPPPRHEVPATLGDLVAGTFEPGSELAPDALLAAWDELLATGVWKAPWRKRAVALCVQWAPIERELLQRAADALAQRLRARPLRASALARLDGAFSRSVRYRLCDASHKRVQDSVQRLVDTSRREPPAPPDEHWRAFAELCAACEALDRMGGDVELRTALQTLRSDLIHVACRLHNDCHLCSPALGMFRWLSRLSERVGTERDKELDRSNAQVRLEARLPSGLSFGMRKARSVAAAVCVTLLGLLLVGEGIYASWGYAALSSRGQRVAAEVVKARVSQGRTATFYIHYRFRDAHGRTHRARGGFLSEDASVARGEYDRAKATGAIEVLYLREDPAWNVPRSDANLSLLAAVVRAALGLLLAGLSIFLDTRVLTDLREMQAEAACSGRPL